MHESQARIMKMVNPNSKLDESDGRSGEKMSAIFGSTSTSTSSPFMSTSTSSTLWNPFAQTTTATTDSTSTVSSSSSSSSFSPFSFMTSSSSSSSSSTERNTNTDTDTTTAATADHIVNEYYSNQRQLDFGAAAGLSTTTQHDYYGANDGHFGGQTTTFSPFTSTSTSTASSNSSPFYPLASMSGNLTSAVINRLMSQSTLTGPEPELNHPDDDLFDGSSSSGSEYVYGSDLFANIPVELTQFATFCCLLFIIVGVPGNLLTIIALARCKKVRNATAYFIINLSLCDLMFCCFNLPLALSMFWHRDWIHGDLMCTLFPFARYGLMAVSIFTVLAITINRYVMIGHPRLYPKMYSNRNLVIKILLIWIGSFGAVVPTLFGAWGKFALDHEIGSCSIVKDSRGRSPKNFLFLLAFGMPCLAIIICYARIFIIVRKATIKSHGPQQPVAAMELAAGGAIANGGTDASGKRSSKKRHSTSSSRKYNQNAGAGLPGSADNSPNKRTKGFLGSMLHRTSTTTTSPPSTPEHGPPAELLKQRPSSIASGNSSSSTSGGGGGGGRSGNNNKSSGILLGRPSIAVIHQRGKMSSKDRKLLWMILVIFATFVICYLPITLVKAISKEKTNSVMNIVGYILIYMTTCMNPIIYVAMSLEYRQAYKSLLFCTNEGTHSRTWGNQSDSWRPSKSKRHSGLKSPSTNSDFVSTSGGPASKNRNSMQ